MNHERIRELLALRLYGEIERLEEQAVAAHLGECLACARFGRELEEGLGRARGAQAAECELPAGWDAGLADATARLRRQDWMRGALLVGSGLAAGVLAMLAWSSFAAPRSAATSVASADADAPAFLRFQGDTPPPQATAGGPATRYQAWEAR